MTSLEEEAKARKERLLALRRRKAGESGTNGVADGLLLARRNFDPDTRTLRKFDPNITIDDTVEKNVEGLSEKIILEDEERQKQELDLTNIAPKRINWDLKRDMEKKLVKLERRTAEAIHTLIRQRIATQKGNEGDLVAALNDHQKDRDVEEEASDEE